MFSTLFIDLRMVVSIQTNHMCHITSTQLRDIFLPEWFFPHLAHVGSSFVGGSVVSRLDMFHTKVLMYRTMVLMVHPTKVRC